MLCKYCFQTDHDIETCKTILCKICKETGHPHWLCKNGKRKQDKKVLSNTGSSVVTTTPTTPRRDIPRNNSLNNISSPTSTTNSLLSAISTSAVTNETRRDVQFYTKQSQRKWADIL